MALRIKCPACSEEMVVGAEAAGEIVLCRVCGRRLRVPGSPADAAPPAAAWPARSPAATPDRAPDREVGRDIDREPDRRRERPRRRPTPPPARRRGVLFWLVLAGGGLIGLFGCGCGGLFLALDTPRWRDHEPARGGYRVEFPGPSRDDLARRRQDPAKPEMTIEGTVMLLRREEFVVGYFDLPAGPRPTDDVLLREAVAGMLRTLPGARATQEDPVLVSDFPGREVVVETPDGAVFVGRVVLAESRVYVVVAGGPHASADSARVRRFIDSFAVTDPDLIAKATARRDAGRRELAALEETRAKAEAERRQRDERQRADEQRRRDALDAQEREYQTALRKEREAFFAPAGRSAPDPYAVPGLVTHLGFDEAEPLWPAKAGRLELPDGATRGPGPRGPALYLPAGRGVALKDLTPWVTSGLRESVTFSGWVKLRFRPVILVQPEGPTGGAFGSVSAGGSQLAFNSKGGRDGVEDEKAPSGGSRVTAPWARDDRWHHVVAVRESRRGDERLVLFLDGEQVAEHAAGAADWSAVRGLLFGIPSFSYGPTWTGPAGPSAVPVPGRPSDLAPTETVCAVDEICVYNRALTPAEVRVLAGVTPVPAELAGRQRPADPTAPAGPVTLTPAPQLRRLAGVAFDPARGAAWAVTDDGPRADLLRLSYPDLRTVARYDLGGAAGPVAFDPVANRLFVVVRPPRTDGQVDRPGEPTPWPAVFGGIHRYDLDAIPAPGPAARLAPTAAVLPRTAWPAPVTALAVTADGDWVVAVTRAENVGRAPTGAVYRLPAHFQNSTDFQTAVSAGTPGYFYRLAPAPAGSGVWYGLESRGGWSRLDAAAWKQETFRQPSVPHVQDTDWAVHPDGGRGYVVNDGGGVDEVRPYDPQSGRPHRRRPLVAPPPRDAAGFGAGSHGGYLGLTADGRYLFQSPSGGGLTVADTTIPTAPDQPPAPSASLRGVGPAAPFWLSPDGTLAVFRTGQVVRVGYPAGAAPVVPAASPRAARVAVAPLPRRAAPRGFTHAGPVPPPATELPGLRFYLPFDDEAGPTVREGVSGKAVGVLKAGEFVDGVRGKALRLSHDPVGRPLQPTALDLADQKGAFRVPAGAPFTLAVWVRPVTPTGRVDVFTAKQQVAKTRFTQVNVYATVGPDGGTLTAWLGELGETSAIPNQHAWSGPVPAAGVWHHLAVVRDDQGVVRVLVDGVEARRWRGRGRFPDEIDPETVALSLPRSNQAVSVDVDELCLFDAALTENEVRKLAGQPPVDPATVAKRFAPEPYRGKAVPAATEIPGLKFYLPCDTFAGGKVVEAVSGKAVGGAVDGRLVDGPRGRGLRLTVTPVKGDPRQTGHGLDLSGTDLLKVPAKGAFTLSVWARVTDESGGAPSVISAESPGAPAKKGATAGSPNPTLRLGASSKVNLFSFRDVTSFVAEQSHGGPGPPPGRWGHLAVVRDGKEPARLYIDGELVNTPASRPFQERLDFANVWLARGRFDAPDLDVDELAFFDRALTPAEVRRLAGK